MNIPTHILDSLARRILHNASIHVPQGYVGVSNLDVSTLEKMTALWGSGNAPYQVSSDYCDKTIYNHCALYQGTAVNIAFRAWHDATHIAHGLTTSTADEIELGLLHVAAIDGKQKRAIIFADTVGQTLHYERFNAFPLDQSAFVHHVIACLAKMTRKQSFYKHSSHHAIHHLRTILECTDTPF